MPKTVFALGRAKSKAEETAELERRQAARAQKELAVFGTERERRPGVLSTDEIWWRQHYEWLKGRGYLLRPRYAPDWVPSWEGSKRAAFNCEDRQVIRVRQQAQLHF
jgi:hypothetical protein